MAAATLAPNAGLLARFLAGCALLHIEPLHQGCKI